MLLTVQNNRKLSDQKIQHGATSLMSCAPKEISRLPAAVIQFIIKVKWSLLQRRYTRKQYLNSCFIFPVRSYSCQSTYRFLKRWFCLDSLWHTHSWVYSWSENSSLRSSEKAALHKDVCTDCQQPPAHAGSLQAQVFGKAGARSPLGCAGAGQAIGSPTAYMTCLHFPQRTSNPEWAVLAAELSFVKHCLALK